MDPKQYRQLLDRLVQQLTDEGKLIEAGWVALRIKVMPADAPEVQVREMRLAFLAGAMHLFGSILQMLDPGSEPTERDFARMEKISTELAAAVQELLRWGMH